VWVPTALRKHIEINGRKNIVVKRDVKLVGGTVVQLRTAQTRKGPRWGAAFYFHSRNTSGLMLLPLTYVQLSIWNV
jgi:hypothetical protein